MPLSPKGNVATKFNKGAWVGSNRPEFDGGHPIPLPEGGAKGEVGQFIFDGDCRYDAADPDENCKVLFGDEWEWDDVRDNFDPWGHTEGESTSSGHYFCPAGSFFHKCRRYANTETDIQKCCIEQVHETRKNQTHPKTCPPDMRNYLEHDKCYQSVYDYCKAKPDDGLSRLNEIAADPVCLNYAQNNEKGQIPLGYFNVLRRLCHTKNGKNLVTRLQEPGCKIYWENLKTSSSKVVDRDQSLVPRDINYMNDVIKSERYKYCFDKNKKRVYHNLLKKCKTSDECHSENIPFDVAEIIDCAELCTDESKNVDSSLRGKCDAAWKQYCTRKKFNTFGSSDIDHKDLCPVYWEKDKIRLAKVGELIRLAKEQKPDSCAFSALTQVDYKKMEKQDPVCWYEPQRGSMINHNVHKFTGTATASDQEKCKSDSYNICCQKIQLEGEISAPNIEIEQSCPKAKLDNDNTITDMENYEVPVPWVAPPFKPDPKCKDTPRPTGIVCEDPEEYPDFSGFMNDMVKFDADEIKEIVTSNWEKKQARDAEELAALEAEIAAMQSNNPTVELNKEAKKVVKKKKKLSFTEKILEFFRKLFGGKKKKTKEEKKKEAEEDEALLEDFTNIPKKQNLFIILVVVFSIFIAYKIFSNKNVQTGIGYGVGSSTGEALGETIFNNSGAIKSAGSSTINTIGNAGSNAMNTVTSSGILDNASSLASSAFNNLSSSGVLDTVGSVGSTLAETAGDVISELI